MSPHTLALRFLLPIAASLAAIPALAAPAPKGCQYQLLATLPVRYTGPSLSLTIEGQINGTPAQMLVDTGAQGSMLTRTGVERRKLQRHLSDETWTGIGGETQMYTAWVKQFRAGPTVTTNEYLRVLGQTGRPPFHDAIVGAPFLLQTDLEISLATKEIRFFKPDGCKNAMLAYWSQDPIEIPFTASDWRDPNPEFTVLLNGKEVTAVIDTGADTTVITRKAAEQAGLKLDAPGVERIDDMVGIGRRSVSAWSTTLDRLQIGRETIRNAEVGVIDTAHLGVDVLLGADFLRSHRVLFAMSQRKLYFTYVGGEPLGQRRRIEPWIQQEADAGNGDAQLTLAWMVQRGQGVPADQDRAKALIRKAADGGNADANIQIVRELIDQGDHADAARRMQAILDRMPEDRYAALWLYLARMHGGDAALAQSGLAAAFKPYPPRWPAPIADFYLGKLGQEALLERSRANNGLAEGRACQALFFVGRYHLAAGDAARAAQFTEREAQCRESE